MTRKVGAYFREKNRKNFFGTPSRIANLGRVGANGGGESGNEEAGGATGAFPCGWARGGRRRRRTIYWSVFLATAALAVGAADRGASQCFWRRWREARRAPSVRTFVAPPVVGFAPSTSVWTVPRTVAVARPVCAAPAALAFPSAPILAPPVCATSFCAASAEVAAIESAPATIETSVAYPAQSVEKACFTDVGTAGGCGNVCGEVCGEGGGNVATCSNVCSPCDALSTCVETEYKEEEITTYETVWDNVTRYRDKTITRQVPETSIKREKVRVERPVWETVEKETTYDVTRYVPETSTQTRTRTVLRPVVQMRERKVVETVNQPVVETVMTQRSYVVNRPTTTYRTEVRDYGGYETQITAIPGRERCCLRWRCGGDYYDPTTGRTRYRLPGLYWTPTQEPTEYRAQKTYRPNLVATQVPTTTYVPETIVENVPTTRTTFRPALVERTVSEPTTVYVRETQTERTPVTTYKPVTERVVKKTPTRVLRTQTTEEIRETPVTTYKTVTEVVKEPYVERVARRVPKVTKTLRPVSVYKTVVPVSSRYLPEATTAPATSAETVETVETFRTETETLNDGKSACCEPSGSVGASWDAADLPPSLTSKTTERGEDAERTIAKAAEGNGWTGTTEVAKNQRERKDGANASSLDWPSGVPDLRRAARPGDLANGKAPPVVSPTSESETKRNDEKVANFEEFDATFEEAEAQSSFEFAEKNETNGALSQTTNDAPSTLEPPSVAPTRATSERR